MMLYNEFYIYLSIKKIPQAAFFPVASEIKDKKYLLKNLIRKKLRSLQN